jgi:hypothetical protein
MYKKSWKDKGGISAILAALIAVVVVVAIVLVAMVATGMIYIQGLTPSGYDPGAHDQNTNTTNTIKGYLSASIVVRYINPVGYWNAMSFSFKVGSLTGSLVAVPVTAQFWAHWFDWTTYNIRGVVKFELTQPGFLYDSGKISVSYQGQLGNGITSTQTDDINVVWANGPAIREHGTYQLTAWLYDGGQPDKIADTMSINVAL